MKGKLFVAGLLASTALVGITPANATLQLAVSVGVSTFTCADNAACDTNLATGTVQTGNVTIGGVTFNGSSQIQNIGPPQNQLSTSSFQIVNNNPSTVTVRFAVSGTNFTGPVTNVSDSSSATFSNDIGGTFDATFFADAANTQGAGTPTSLPGSNVGDSGLFTDTLITDSTSFSTTSPFVAPGLYSMSMGTTAAIVGGGTVTGRNQTILAVAVPEPGSLFLFGGSLLALAGIIRRKKKGNGTIAAA